MTAWAFAIDAWRRPGVEAISLRLQAEHGQCPPLLLWRLWVASEHRAVPSGSLDAAVAMCREWESDVTHPLRAVRDRLGVAAGGLPPASRLTMRKAVLAVELEAERLLLGALETIETTPTSREQDLLPTLVAVADAWRPPAPLVVLSELAQALRGPERVAF